MSRIDELIERLCPDGVEHKALGEVGTFTRGSGIQKKDFVDEGIGCIHYGQIYTSYGLFADKTPSFISPDFARGKRMAKQGDLVIATTSENEEDVCKAVAWLGDEEIAVSNDAYIFSHSLNPKYMAYFFQSNLFQTQKRSCITGTKVLRVSGDSMAKFKVPVPPMEIQEEIVRILDSFSELEAKLEAELEARKTQYTFYRSRLLSFSKGESRISWRRLGEIGKLCMCKRIFKSQTSKSGDVPFYKIGTFGGNPDAFISRELYQEYRMKYSYPKKGDLLISCSGTIGKTVVFDGSDSYYQDSNIVWIDNDESLVTNPFLRHIYSVIKWPISKGGTIGRLYGKDIERIPIPIPPLEEQCRIVSILDKFDALVNNLSSGIPAEIEARRKQYEYYRDKLLTFKEKSGD